MRHCCIGILAHVDAGKTTLSEALLYSTGAIRQLGRVDHRNSYLDTHDLERSRGITIFSKQALFQTGDLSVTLLDTPGHVDFSSETERTLQVLDYAVLVISGTDGVQAHTETLWHLLRRNHIPTFLFVTKCDLTNPGQDAIMDDLRRHLNESCVSFSAPEDTVWEEAAVQDESALNEYLETGCLTKDTLARLVREESLFPCFFGSALRLEGVDSLLQGLSDYTIPASYDDCFAARVFKISRDPQGNRLTWMKVVGGSLSVRDTLTCPVPDGDPAEEKVSQLRLYSGARFQTAETVVSGQICAALGLNHTFPGQGLGALDPAPAPVLEPVLNYRMLLPNDCDPRLLLPKLRILEEEDPQLHVVWDSRLQEIHVQMMGPIQTEILKSVVAQRFGTEIELDAGSILYKETIRNTVEGVGHFEPLRHYAEVHLLLEPLEQGRGLVFETRCSEDLLDRNWQRLILTHLAEKPHLGVLTGSPITDVKITLMSGRAHLKHTEGGDFRQATYRAVRQGLMQAESILLEPWYSFRLEFPSEHLGRAMSDLQLMHAEMQPPEIENELAILTGRAPISVIRDYPLEFTSYTRGRGQFFSTYSGYAPCPDSKQVLDTVNYDPVQDLPNTPDSVFCSHGAGFNVAWDQVHEYMHLESCLKPAADPEQATTPVQPRVVTRNLDIDEKELMAIFEREFGPIRHRERQFAKVQEAPAPKKPIAPMKKKYLIVDGYNMIFAWPELKELAKDDLDFARQRLLDMMSNYRGCRPCELVVVFDGYRVKGNPGTVTDHHGVHVVYTKQDETGDMYIERLTNEIGQNYSVRVATSDALIQLSAVRSGVLRVSAEELYLEVEEALSQMRQSIARSNLENDRRHSKKNRP